MTGPELGVENETVVDTYDRVAAIYDRVVGPIEADLRRDAIAALGVEPGDRVLEIGCGPGHALVELARDAGPGGDVIGLDAAPAMLDRASRRTSAGDGTGDRTGDRRASVDLVLGDALGLPFEDGTIDAIFAEATLELFSATDLTVVLAACRRVLEPDGRLGAVTMDRHGLEADRFVRAYEWAFEHLPGYDRVGCRPVYARRAIEAAGFAIDRHERFRRAGVWPVDLIVAHIASEASDIFRNRQHLPGRSAHMEYEKPQFFNLIQYAADADRDVVDMVSGNPDWEPPEALREALAEYADGPADTFQYPPSDGLAELRAEIADRRNVDESQVIVTNGTGEANYLGMAGALDRDAGEKVILTDPVYPYYTGKTAMLGGDATLVPTNPDGSLDAEAICETIDRGTALIVLTTPNNPTGAVYDIEKIRAVVETAEDHDAIVVVDEVYDHFDHTGSFESALSIDSPNRIATSGFSKSMAITGFRVGYGIFPDEFADAARTRHMLVNVTGSRPAQKAVYEALRETPPEYYEEARSLVADRIDTFTGALEAAGAEYTRPEGAFYVLVRFEGFPGTTENAKRLIDEAGVAGMPGATFGTARSEWLRFALVTPRVEEAADRLAEYFADGGGSR